MPFKHYIQKIEGKLAVPKVCLVRYKKYNGQYRYGVKVKEEQSASWVEGGQTWAWWANTPEEAIALYHRGVEKDLLHPFGKGCLTWTESRMVEEFDYAI